MEAENNATIKGVQSEGMETNKDDDVLLLDDDDGKLSQGSINSVNVTLGHVPWSPKPNNRIEQDESKVETKDATEKKKKNVSGAEKRRRRKARGKGESNSNSAPAASSVSQQSKRGRSPVGDEKLTPSPKRLQNVTPQAGNLTPAMH